MLSGGRDSVCLLDLAVRLLGPDAVTALHVNYGLREDSDEDEAHCAALCERLGVSLEVERPAAARGPGNLQAWARDARYAAAARLAAARRRRAIATGHTADDQVETILYRLASSPEPAGAAGDAAHGTAAWCGRCSASPASRPPPTARSAASPGATTRRNDEARLRAQPGPPRPRRRRWPRSTRRRRRNVLRTAELLRDEAEVLDALVDAELDGSDGVGRGTIALERLARAAAGAAPPGRPAPRRPRRRAARSPAPPTTPTRSRRCAAPAPRCSTSAAASAPWSSAASLRAER